MVTDIEPNWKRLTADLVNKEEEVSHLQNKIIKLMPSGKKGRIAWRRQLFSEDPSQFYHGVRSALGIHSKNWNQFFIALLSISFFTYRMRERVLKDEMGLGEYLNRLNDDYKISDDTTLVLFQLGREKKEIHYFSKLTSFISKWNIQCKAVFYKVVGEVFIQRPCIYVGEIEV